MVNYINRSKRDNPVTKIVIMSAGFKHGFPRASHIFDVTSCPNPKRHVKERDKYDKYMSENSRVINRIRAIRDYIQSVGNDEPGVYAICCTGGHHRSVYIANEVARELENRTDWEIIVNHVDRWTE